MSLPIKQVLLHASAAAVMAAGYLGLGTLEVDTWIRSQRGGHFQFLTIQGQVTTSRSQESILIIKSPQTCPRLDCNGYRSFCRCLPVSPK